MTRTLAFILGLALLGALAACTQMEALSSEAQSGEKKLIYYGWGMPTAAAAKERQAEFNAAPFDGATFKHSGAKEIFTRQALPDAPFNKDIADLKALNSSKLSDSFLRMQVKAECGWDWKNEGDWAAFASNVRNYARVAREANLAGALFDPEPYGCNIWNYQAQPSGASFEELEAITKRRGADFVRILKEEYPGITLFSLKLISNRLYYLDDNPSPAEVEERIKDDTFMGLWFGFVNGMVSELDETITLIEGNARAYYHFTDDDFDQAVREIDTAAAPAFLDPGNVETFRSEVDISNSVFVDGVLNLKGTPAYTGWYYRNDDERRKQLEHNIYHALRASDEYAWLYLETKNWWKGEPPEQFEEIVARAKNKVNAGQALGIDMGFAERAKNGYESRVRFGGKIKPGVPDVELKVTGAPDAACNVINNGKKYGCHIPVGLTVTVRPVAAGVTFSPASRTYTNVGSERIVGAGDQDFSSR